jgi:hypothetical protein
MRWRVFNHPPYNPDLSPCDFHVFGPLKKFGSDDDVKAAVVQWFQQQPVGFFAKKCPTGYLGAIFNSLCCFVQNNLPTDFISTSLIRISRVYL